MGPNNDKLTGLFCKKILGTQDGPEDFEVSEFSHPSECLGRTLIAILTVGTDVSEKTLEQVKARMQARTREALFFAENGRWLIGK